MTLGVAIVGCGLIGRKRALALSGQPLCVCADVDLGRAESLARTVPGARAVDSWQEAINDARVGIVIVATINDALAPITAAAIAARKHVLVEKPAGLNVAEIERLPAMARSSRTKVR